jgi:hypothetical protein
VRKASIFENCSLLEEGVLFSLPSFLALVFLCPGMWMGGAAVAYTFLSGFRALWQVRFDVLSFHSLNWLS